MKNVIYLAVVVMIGLGACKKEVRGKQNLEESANVLTEEAVSTNSFRGGNCDPGCNLQKKRQRCLKNRFVLVRLKRICDKLYGKEAFPDFEELRKDKANLRGYAYLRLEYDGLPFYLPILRSLISADNMLPVINAAPAYCDCDETQTDEMLRYASVGRYKLYWCNSCEECELTEHDR